MAVNQYLSLPAAATGAAPVSSASAWVFGTAISLSASTSVPMTVVGFQFQNTDTPAVDVNQDILFEVTVNGVTTLQLPFNMKADEITTGGYHQTSSAAIQAFYLPEPYYIPSGKSVQVKVADSIAAALTYNGVKLIYREEDLPVTTPNTVDVTDFGSDTTPTLEFTGTDSSQNNDLRYNVQIDTANTFNSVVGSEALSDSYDVANRTGALSIGASFYGAGQTFVGDGGLLTKIAFVISGVVSNPEIVYIRLYAVTTTDHSTAVPTGAPLAEYSAASNTFSSSTTTFQVKTLNTPYQTTAGTLYAVVMEYVSANAIGFGIDGTTKSHVGATVRKDTAGVWTNMIGTYDACFQVYTIGSGPALNEISGTDVGFAVSDTFNDNAINTTMWDANFIGTGNTLSETGGQGSIVLSGTSGSYSAYYTSHAYDLTANSVSLKAVTVPPNAATNAQAYIKLELNSTNFLAIGKQGANLYMQRQLAGADSTTTLAYDTTNHAYWRIRESGGNILWDTSADGITWTNRRSLATPFAVTALKPQLGAGTFAAQTSPGSFVFDNYEFTEADPYKSGDQIGFTVQAANALTSGTYYWRSRALDPTGSNAYGGWSATRSFTLSAGTITPQAITGLARIEKTLLQLQLGKSAILKTTTNDQTGLSRVTKTELKDQTGISRITKTVPQTVTGVSRIEKTITADQTGVANIVLASVTTAQTQTGLSRIEKIVTPTTTGVARIEKSVSVGQPGIARVTVTAQKLQTGISRITTVALQAQLGKAAVLNSVLKLQAGLSRLTVTTLKTETGVANVTVVGTKDQAGVARIQTVPNRDQTGVAKISDPRDYTYENIQTLPTTATNLANAFTAGQYTAAATDDNSYVDLSGNNNLVYMFNYGHYNNTDSITITVNVKSTFAPSLSAVHLQIWNFNTSLWETLQSNTSAAANAEFSLTGTKNTSVANYYDASKRVIARVYQVA